MTPHAKCTFYGHDSQRRGKGGRKEGKGMKEKKKNPTGKSSGSSSSFTFNVINARQKAKRNIKVKVERKVVGVEGSG